MANGVIVQFAVLLALAFAGVGLFMVYRKRNATRGPSAVVQQFPAVPMQQSAQQRPVQPSPLSAAPPRSPVEPELQAARTVAVDKPATAVVAPKPAIDLQSLTLSREDRNERILAGISENIQKSLAMRPVAQHSPIPYTDLKPRNTEYIRVKKEIITPHGQVRFSILKDWMSTNMLAVFRRASLDWKTPDDLIAFVPAYLEPEAEILNGQVLLVGTPGHNEKLAVPIRNLDEDSSLRNCFDFVTDVGNSANTPAVLLPSETEFEVVSRGVITQGTFMIAVEQGQTPVKLLADRYSAALAH